MYNNTLTCESVAAVTAAGGGTRNAPYAPPPPVTLVAETAQQLLRGIQLLGRLQPSTITLARDMSVPADSWPAGLKVTQSLVLAGLPPPAPRTLLDMYQVIKLVHHRPLCHCHLCPPAHPCLSQAYPRTIEANIKLSPDPLFKLQPCSQLP